MAGGILGLFGAGDGEGSGLLGNMGSGLNSYAAQNSNALIGAGAALLGGQGWDGAGQGYMQGQRQDMLRREVVAKKDEKIQKKAWARSIAPKIGMDPAQAEANPDAAEAVWRTVQANNLTRQPSEWQQLIAGLSPEDQKRATEHKLFGAPPAPSWGVIGQDDYGNNNYGFVDPRKGTVTPSTLQPQQVAAPSGQGGAPDAVSLPPAPAGVNPKIWRDEQTRIAANEGKQSEKMRGDLATTRQAADGLKSELKVLKDQVKRYGAELVDGPEKAAMQTTYTNIQMQLKNLYQLGAITGPDMEILTKIIENPTASGPGEYVGKSFRREARTAAQINQLERIIDNSVKNAERNLGGSSGGGASGSTGGFTQSGAGRTSTGVPWTAKR